MGATVIKAALPPTAILSPHRSYHAAAAWNGPTVLPSAAYVDDALEEIGVDTLIPSVNQQKYWLDFLPANTRYILLYPSYEVTVQDVHNQLGQIGASALVVVDDLVLTPEIVLQVGRDLQDAGRHVESAVEIMPAIFRISGVIIFVLAAIWAYRVFARERKAGQ